MSTELERRLEGFLGELPEPEPGVGERAVARAVAAVEPTPTRHRRLRAAVLSFALVGVVLAAAAGSLAAVGALHVGFDRHSPSRPAVETALRLPGVLDGVAAIVDGRLSVTTRTGFRLQGQAASAAALSPHALYVAAGIGDSLVALAPDGRRPWSLRAGGPVAAIAWAPDGFRIAYVVRTSTGSLVLHVVYGNGTHDTVIDRNVRGVAPAWRYDSLAFAYVGAGGRPVVYDLAHASRRVIRTPAARGAIRLAFAPRSRDLAVGTASAVVVYPTGRSLVGRPLVLRGKAAGVGWLRAGAGEDLVVVGDGARPLATGHLFESFGPAGEDRPRRSRLPGRVLGFVTTERHNTMAFAVATARSVRLVVMSSGHSWTVATLPARTRIRDLAIG